MFSWERCSSNDQTVAGPTRFLPKGDTDLITPTNDSIRAMAAAENIDLIDLAGLFTGQVDTWIGQDGLHPTEAGHAEIAKAFFDAIRTKFERPTASAVQTLRR